MMMMMRMGLMKDNGMIILIVMAMRMKILFIRMTMIFHSFCAVRHVEL